MDAIFGNGNSLTDYLLVLVIYGLLYLLIRYPKPALELNYRSNFFFLFIFWGGLMFIGNYLGYRLGIMAFLPWLNNFLHSFVWVGLCLGWLFYTTKGRPIWEQFLLFAFTSFLVKMAENMLLGTWSMESYLGIRQPYAYLLVMSVVDGFYPVLTIPIIKWLGRKSTFGVYAPA